MKQQPINTLCSFVWDANKVQEASESSVVGCAGS